MLRILSIDGGGLRGIYAASLIAEWEAALGLSGKTHRYFDYIAGTSTGAVIGLGLALGKPATEIIDLYVNHGRKVFPTQLFGIPRRLLQNVWHPYRHSAFEDLLREGLGDAEFGDLPVRMCVPSCDGTLGETWIFKTPHHEDFKSDWRRPAAEIARASSAAPTFLRPLLSGGNAFLDGGLFVNNPVMVAVADALGCYAVSPRAIRILSLGSGGKRMSLSPLQKLLGGRLIWAPSIAETMIDFSVQNADGQARLIVGHENVIRIVPPDSLSKIAMDDYVGVIENLPNAAVADARHYSQTVSDLFFQSEARQPTFFYGSRSAPVAS